jgi:pyruvate/2-oxoglutarate dehydrogenase complex dihydrolipoamide acyltransferase (E2) component
MDGGTFTISNGGVFGSLMGTPIINPPQSAILGMHAINDRPVAINGKVQTYIVTLHQKPFSHKNKNLNMKSNFQRTPIMLAN